MRSCIHLFQRLLHNERARALMGKVVEGAEAVTSQSLPGPATYTLTQERTIRPTALGKSIVFRH